MPTPPRTLTHDGRTRTLFEWAKLTRLPTETIRSRIDKQGWTVARALTEPLDARFSKRGKKLPSGVPRPVPALKRHPRGNAYATWHANDKQQYRYFGRWGTKEAAARYQRFAAEWVAGMTAPAKPPPGHRPTVADLILAFLPHAEAKYRKDDKPTSHVHRFKSAMVVLAELYGEQPVNDFVPDHLLAYVTHLIGLGHSLRTVNEYQWRVVYVFKWGVAHGGMTVDPTTAHRLAAVEKTAPGRTAAPDPEPVTSAPSAHVEAAIPRLHRLTVRQAVFEAMVRLQLAAGMRSGELCAMRSGEIERSGQAWRYEPARVNKNRHRGKRRVVWLGPRAQAVLEPLLANLGADEYVFAYPRKKDGPRRRVTVSGYLQAVQRACDAAGVPRWHPHQLRHNRATEVHRRYEDDAAAAAAIGDTPEVARQIYTDDPAQAVAKRIAMETG